MTVPAFKAGDSALRESNGGFDSHTLPPHLTDARDVTKNQAAKGGDKSKSAGFVLLNQIRHYAIDQEKFSRQAWTS